MPFLLDSSKPATVPNFPTQTPVPDSPAPATAFGASAGSSALKGSSAEAFSLRDFHVHTRFCDGSASVEEMAEAALAKGMDALGFSEHGHTFFDHRYSLLPGSTQEYRRQVAMCKERYAGRLRILCGVERDYYSNDALGGFDYTIGSVHYLKAGGSYYALDDSPDDLRFLANRFFAGDMLALCEEYYRCVADVVRATGANIVGHFDLIAKYNQRHQLFDETHERYAHACEQAVEALIPTEALFEINTSVLAKGYRSEAYPSVSILRMIAERGGSVILSSDSHAPGTLCARFEEVRGIAEALGLRVCDWPC